MTSDHMNIFVSRKVDDDLHFYISSQQSFLLFNKKPQYSLCLLISSDNIFNFPIFSRKDLKKVFTYRYIPC